MKEEIAKNGHEWRKNALSARQRIVLQVDRNDAKPAMNCTSNCFRTHPILQTWSPATTGYLQTSKECSRERDLAPMKWHWKLKRILRPKTNRSTKWHRIVRETLESECHPRRRLCWWIKSNFAEKLFVLLVRPGTYWVMYYTFKNLNPCSLSLSLSLSLFLSLTFFDLTAYLTYEILTPVLPLFLSLLHSHTHTHIYTLSRSDIYTPTLSLTYIHSYAPSPRPFYYTSYIKTSLSLSLSLYFTHIHIYTHSLSVSFICRCLPPDTTWHKVKSPKAN